MYKWNVLPDAPKDFYSKHPELPPIITRLLWNRNLKEQKLIDEFLNPDYGQDIHDPFLFKDMAKAVKIIFKALEEKKKIVVHGDYDADGVCSSAILVKTLMALGAEDVSLDKKAKNKNSATVDVFIPHREIDGYGLNLKTIKQFKKQKIDLIITCDCGVSNIEEIKQAKENGIQVIITDHHSPSAETPIADAIIHPQMPDEPYPDKGLCGAGVAFKLAQGLLIEHKKNNEKLNNDQLHESFEKWMLDLVALASIGDMVPLLGESRTLVKYGLIVLNKTNNLGLQKLFQITGITDEDGSIKREINSHSVGFQIVPRLNAAGRMDHANTAYALLISEKEKEASKLAKQLNKNNQDRQKLTEKIVKKAKEQIEKNQKDKYMLFASSKGWSTGILGLVAGRLKEQYYKPVIIMGINKGEVTGSGRSIAELNLIEALREIPEYFEKFGGHPQACGLSLKNPKQIEEFQEKLNELVKQKIGNLELSPQIQIDSEVTLEEVDWKLYDLLQKFSPFGQRNEEPKYLAKGLIVTDIQPVGQDGKHLRLMVKHNSHVVRKTIGFGLGDCNRHPDDWKNNLNVGDKIDMVFAIGVNEWNGNRELQLTVEDIRLTKK